MEPLSNHTIVGLGILVLIGFVVLLCILNNIIATVLEHRRLMAGITEPEPEKEDDSMDIE